MPRRVMVLGVLFIFATAAVAGADDGRKFSYDGVYTAWFQSQQDFTFGADYYNDNYTVQMLRLNLQFDANEYVGAVTRFDLGQGWWGVDNADRTTDRPGGGAGGSQLFDFKDTNFLLHVDQAYGVIHCPTQDIHLKVGRSNYSIGNKLLVDANLDGIQLEAKGHLHIGYAKVSEGVDGLMDDSTVRDGTGAVIADGGDAHLLMGSVKGDVGGVHCGVYGMFYKDNSDRDGTAFVPNGLDYFRARFTPQVTQLSAFGAIGKWKSEDLGLTVMGEANVLTGKDDIAETTIDARGVNDINNGDIKGFNIYLKADKKVTDKVSVGGVFGMGSGDDDVTDAEGNVNKLRTSGFFYLTEVWEDSIMPDQEGITPQGLGAPNVRGYRELENTTAFQGNVTLEPADNWTAYFSYTFLKATEAIPEWEVDSSGATPVTVVDYTNAADDIGSEVDYKLVWTPVKKFAVGVRGGYFWPGAAAGNLVNGHADNDDMAWETKGFVTIKI